MKTGWWSVKFEITLDGKNVRFWDLSEATQEHILDCIRNDSYSGEVLEEDDDDDEEEE